MESVPLLNVSNKIRNLQQRISSDLHISSICHTTDRILGREKVQVGPRIDCQVPGILAGKHRREVERGCNRRSGQSIRVGRSSASGPISVGNNQEHHLVRVRHQ